MVLFQGESFFGLGGSGSEADRIISLRFQKLGHVPLGARSILRCPAPRADRELIDYPGESSSFNKA